MQYGAVNCTIDLYAIGSRIEGREITTGRQDALALGEPAIMTPIGATSSTTQQAGAMHGATWRVVVGYLRPEQLPTAGARLRLATTLYDGSTLSMLAGRWFDVREVTATANETRLLCAESGR